MADPNIDVPGFPSPSGVSGPPQDPVLAWKTNQKSLENLQGQLGETPPPPVTWGDKHHVLYGLLSLIPGFQQGYESRTRLNQRAQKIAEEHRQNTIMDQMNILRMKQRGELSPQDAARNQIQAALFRQKERQYKMEKAMQIETQAARLAHYGLMETYAKNKAKTPKGGVGKKEGRSTSDPFLSLFRFARTEYDKSIAKNYLSGLMGGEAPPDFGSWAKSNLPAPVYQKLVGAGYIQQSSSSSQGVPSPANPDFTFVPGKGLVPYGKP